MDPKLVEKLHEDASNAYLQGDVERALSLWREVLEAEPGDERAREGVSLCERMTGCESASVVTTGQSPFAVGSAPESQGDDESPENVPEDLGEPLDRLLEMGAPPSPPRARAIGSPGPPAAEKSGNLLDLSDLADDAGPADGDRGFDFDELLGSPASGAPSSEAGGIPASLFDDDPFPEPGAESAESESLWHFGTGPENPEPLAPDQTDEMNFGNSSESVDPPTEEPDFGPPETPPAEPEAGPFVDPPPQAFAEDVAASSLHRRVSGLLATALAEMEHGDRELALTTLDRLLILDDDNEAAISLRAKLSAELQSAAAAPSAADEAFDRLEIEGCGGDLLDLARDTPQDPGEPVEVAPEPLVAAEVEAGGEALDEEFLDEASLPAAEPVACTVTPADTVKAVPSARRFALPSIPGSRKIWIPALAVVVLGLGFVVWNMLLGGGEAGAESGAAVARVEPSESSPPKPKPVEADPAEPVATEAAKTAEEQLAEILQQADAALAQADYAAAIVSFNAALQLQPGNAELLGRLESAGESYRVQQAKQERWNQAVDDFGKGDYRAALAFFYRLPEDEHTESVDRYIRNGWYNLGVTALKSRECAEALEHFGEARRLDSTDPGVLEAASLALRCKSEGSAAIQPLVAALRHRSLEDSR